MFGANKSRVFTGLALIGVVLLIAFFHSKLLLWAIFGVIAFIGVSEALVLFKINDGKKIYMYTVLIWVFAFFLPNIANYLPFFVAMIFASILAYKKDFDLRQFLPLVYPLTPMLFLLTLYNTNGITTLLWLVVIVASCDTGAYFVGRSIGKTPFSPSSPNKTLEGVIGGVLIASIAGGIVGLISTNFNLYSILITFLVAVSSVFGDLFESYLKREAGVKDSGTLLPGHGGVLDRMDGYLFASVSMYIFISGLV